MVKFSGVAQILLLFLDINGDGYIDAFELEAIFQPELDKIWDPNNPEDDMNEMEEVSFETKINKFFRIFFDFFFRNFSSKI